MRKEPDLIAMLIVLGMIVVIMTVVYGVVFVLGKSLIGKILNIILRFRLRSL